MRLPVLIGMRHGVDAFDAAWRESILSYSPSHPENAVHPALALLDTLMPRDDAQHGQCECVVYGRHLCNLDLLDMLSRQII